jgi:peroxiredoxin
MGLVTAVGCNGSDNNGYVSNGEPNSEEPNGGLAEPDLSGLGLIVDCDENTGSEPVAGDMALDFRFQDAAGTTFALSDFRGRVVMLSFWGTHCGFCIAEMPLIQQIYDQWPATELVLLTIDKGEEPAAVAAFMQDGGYSLPVVVDREEKLSTQYGVTGIPHAFFIDEEGIIQVSKLGYFHTLEDIEAILNDIIGNEGG